METLVSDLVNFVQDDNNSKLTGLCSLTSSYFTGDHKVSLCWTRIILRTVDREMKLLQREEASKNYFQKEIDLKHFLSCL